MSPDLAAIKRWIDAGGEWSVIHDAGHRVTVELRRCDGGEVVDRLESSELDVLDFVLGPN